MAPDAVGRHLTDAQIRNADRQVRVVGVSVSRGKGGGEHLKAAVQQRRIDAAGVPWRQSSDRFAVAPPDICHLLERRPVLQTVLRESAVERRRGNLFSTTILDVFGGMRCGVAVRFAGDHRAARQQRPRRSPRGSGVHAL